MIILFKGTSFEDSMIGRLDYLVEIENGTDKIDVEAIKNSIRDVKEYIDEVLNDEDSENYDEVEMWGAYECVSEALDRLGYTYNFIDDALESDTFRHIALGETKTGELYAETEIEV